MHPRFNFLRAQHIFIKIVAVSFFDGKRSVGVSPPAAAEVNAFANSSDTIFPCYSEGGGVVFAITYIREPDFTNNGGVKGARCAQAVYAQKVIVAIFLCPFSMINKTRRDFFELFIHNSVRTNNHCVFSPPQHIHNFLQSFWGAVEIIGVKLHGKAAAEARFDGLIPATADA